MNKSDINIIINLIKNKLKNINNTAKNLYNYKPAILSAELDIIDRKNQVKTIKVNNNSFAYTNFFKVIVDQKLDYLLAKEPTYEDLPNEFGVDILDEMSLESALSSVSWLHLFLNKNQKLDWILVDDREIIHIWDSFKKEIIRIIRFYVVDKDEKIIKVEVWDDNEIAIFNIKRDKLELIEGTFEIKSHYKITSQFKNSPEPEKKIELKSFGFLPFIPLWNNRGKTDDSENLERLIYYYNQINSGFIDNIFKFQEFILLLKGIGGQDLEILMSELKKYKALKASQPEVDAEYLKVDIPVEARSVILEILKKNIFLIGRAVDLKELQGLGSNITNVLIKAMYADLDMKANELEKQLKLFYKKLIYCINTYYGFNIKDEITFNRSMIFNEGEVIGNCVASLGIISKKTIVENHPWVDNADEEMKRIEEEEAAYKLEGNIDGESNLLKGTGQNNNSNSQ